MALVATPIHDPSASVRAAYVVGATCDLYAAPDGDDSARGSRAQPLRTVQRLVVRLRPGMTGCLLTGTYNGPLNIRRGGRQGAVVTLRSAPRARATLVGRVVVHDHVTDVTIAGLRLNGTNGSHLPSPTINGDRIAFIGNDIVSDGICVMIGSTSGWGMAEDAVIARNRIHNCGRLPETNREHGIYDAGSARAVIEDNLIYDNADRGIQLYPAASATIIRRNVIWRNGEGIIFSGNGNDTTSGTRVVGNIIGRSRIRFNIEAYWENDLGTDNQVGANCIWAGHKGNVSDQRGFVVVSKQLIADPRFRARSPGDFTLRRSSPCKAFGPR